MLRLPGSAARLPAHRNTQLWSPATHPPQLFDIEKQTALSTSAPRGRRTTSGRPDKWFGQFECWLTSSHQEKRHSHPGISGSNLDLPWYTFPPPLPSATLPPASG